MCRIIILFCAKLDNICLVLSIWVGNSLIYALLVLSCLVVLVRVRTGRSIEGQGLVPNAGFGQFVRTAHREKPAGAPYKYKLPDITPKLGAVNTQRPSAFIPRPAPHRRRRCRWSWLRSARPRSRRACPPRTRGRRSRSAPHLAEPSPGPPPR